MEENETLESEIESGANSEGASSDASDDSSGNGEQAKASAPKEQPETIDYSKAFEHPRFKELVEQKNQALAAQKSLEQRYAQLEQRLNQPQTPQGPSKEQTEFDGLINDLKQVDPRLAAQFQAMSKANTTVTELQQKLEAFEKRDAESRRNSEIQSAVAKINQLHETNKVSPEVKAILNDKFDLLYMQGKLTPQNLEEVYKGSHESISKFMDSLKRSEREAYVADKKKDASVPTSQPKGTPAKSAPKKTAWSKDPEVAKQQIVSRFLKQQSANKDADSV